MIFLSEFFRSGWVRTAGSRPKYIVRFRQNIKLIILRHNLVKYKEKMLLKYIFYIFIYIMILTI